MIIKGRLNNTTIQSVLNDEDRVVAVTFDVDSDGSRLERVEVMGGYYYGIKFETKWDWVEADRSGACIKVTPGYDDIAVRRCEIYNWGRAVPGSAEAIDNNRGIFFLSNNTQNERRAR